MQFEVSPVFAVFCLGAIALCLLLSFQLVNLEATVNLLCFNLLFVSLTFILKTPFNTKLALLALGNVLGVLCNFFFSLFYNAGCTIFGNSFNFVYVILYPFFNFMWIVTYWSLSIAALASKRESER